MPVQADGILHVHIPNDDVSSEAFIFNDGTFVTWGTSIEENDSILETLKPFEVNSYSTVETESFDYYQDPSQ